MIADFLVEASVHFKHGLFCFFSEQKKFQHLLQQPPSLFRGGKDAIGEDMPSVASVTAFEHPFLFARIKKNKGVVRRSCAKVVLKMVLDKMPICRDRALYRDNMLLWISNFHSATFCS